MPVFGGHAGLFDLAERSRRALGPLTGEFEFIAVSDGAGHAASTALRALCGTYPWARGIELETRVGQHLATLAGLRAARLDWVATIDDDLQHPPEQLARLIGAIEPQVDLIYGAGSYPDQTWLRRSAANCARILLALRVGHPAMLRASSMRLLRRDLRDSLDGVNAAAPVLDVALGCGAREVRSVPVLFSPREGGTSGYGWSAAAKLFTAVLRAPRQAKRPSTDGSTGPSPYAIAMEHGGPCKDPPDAA